MGSCLPFPKFSQGNFPGGKLFTFPEILQAKFFFWQGVSQKWYCLHRYPIKWHTGLYPTLYNVHVTTDVYNALHVHSHNNILGQYWYTQYTQHLSRVVHVAELLIQKQTKKTSMVCYGTFRNHIITVYKICYVTYALHMLLLTTTQNYYTPHNPYCIQHVCA